MSDQPNPQPNPDIDKNTDTGGGTYVGGDASAGSDLIGRDKQVGQDEVRRDKLTAETINIYHGAPPQEPTLPTAAEPPQADGSPEPPAPGEPPYQGLQYFDVDDAHLFFGRETLAATLANQLTNQSFLAIIGASGSGKSSLVRAGLIPILMSGDSPIAGIAPPPGCQNWAIEIITPKAKPLTELAVCLTQHEPSDEQDALVERMRAQSDGLDNYVRRYLQKQQKTRLLLVVDQFEELFTHHQSSDPADVAPNDNERGQSQADQEAFVRNLLTAANHGDRTTVVLTARTDFYSRCLDFSELRDVLPIQQVNIGPMDQDEIRRAIEQPALTNGWDFEPLLVDDMLDEMSTERGTLPLLSHALLETWKRRQGRTMTRQGYRDAGRIHGAIAQTAEAFYKALPQAEKTLARNIFIRLTSLGEGTEDTRRRVNLDELRKLRADQHQVDKIVAQLADARLITTDRDHQSDDEQADVAHEALIRNWKRLEGWLRTNRDGLRTHRRLTETAQAWADTERQDTSLLYSGTQLDLATVWANDNPGELNELEQAFLDASVRERDRQQAERDRLQREREEARASQLVEARKARNRSLVALVATTALLITAIAAGFYLFRAFQRQNNELTVRDAIEQARTSKDALQLQQAIDDYTEADRLNQALGAGVQINLTSEITEAIRYVLPQLIAKSQRNELEGTPAEIISSIISADKIAQSNGVQLGIDVKEEISNTLRVLIPPMVREGEALVKAGDFEQAEAKFADIRALNPPSNVPHYIRIPAGPFTMGEGDSAQEIALEEYWILSTEVTNALYKECVDDPHVDADERCTPPNNNRWDRAVQANHPVADVTWHDAQTYAAYVGGYLPTEAMWEKACRGTDKRTYSWGDEEPTVDLLNYLSGGSAEVGSYPPGANGLFDMAGNVREWAADEWAPGSDRRSLRGGAFWRLSNSVRCASRGNNDPAFSYSGGGFRVVLLESPGLLASGNPDLRNSGSSDLSKEATQSPTVTPTSAGTATPTRTPTETPEGYPFPKTATPIPQADAYPAPTAGSAPQATEEAIELPTEEPTESVD